MYLELTDISKKIGADGGPQWNYTFYGKREGLWAAREKTVVENPCLCE